MGRCQAQVAVADEDLGAWSLCFRDFHVIFKNASVGRIKKVPRVIIILTWKAR